MVLFYIIWSFWNWKSDTGFCWQILKVKFSVLLRELCLVEMASNATAGHACPPPMKATSNGIFQGDDPLHFALPLAILQICIVVIVTRGLAYVLRPLRQPRVIAEIVVSYFFFLTGIKFDQSAVGFVRDGIAICTLSVNSWE